MRARLTSTLIVLLALFLVPPMFANANHQGALVVAPVGDPFEGCEEIVTNTTSKTQFITVRICNSDESFPMDVDVGGKKIISIPAGKCRTFIVELKPGEFLHADRDGKITYPRATAVGAARQ